MGRPGVSVWWSCLLLLSLTTGEPQFLLVVPAVVESGGQVQFCSSLLQISDDITVSVSLSNQVLHNHTYTTEEHGCQSFQAPLVEKQQILDFVFEVKGQTFYSKQTRKIQVRNYGPRTFIQTDKPIYLPGQTVHFRVVTLDSKLRPAVGLYNIIEIEDGSYNRIGQWLDTSSKGQILQLSYALNSEAREGHYRVSVSTNGTKISQTFIVDKYVLPKFSVDLKAPNEVSIGQEELKYDVCGKYTFGQSVPGMVESQVCRLPESYHYTLAKFEPICHKEEKQVGKDGCAKFVVPLLRFMNNSRLWMDELYVRAKITEEGTDVQYPAEQKIRISYQIGNVSFVDPPQLYTLGSVVNLTVKVVHHNDTPVSDTVVYLIKISSEVHDSQKTDKDGFVTFTFNTTSFPKHVNLKASLYREHTSTYKTPHFSSAYLSLSESKPPSTHTKTVSSVEVKTRGSDLQCGPAEDFSISYTVVGERPGPLHLMYVVLSRGVIVKYGHERVEINNDAVLEGQVKFQIVVSPEMAPVLQVVAFAVLPSENVIAHAHDFTTDKCFRNQVQLEFSPPSSVPGEDTTLKVSALPHSLCGVSAVDKSVLLKEPGKTLNKDQIFSLLPLQKAGSYSYELEDQEECLKVRNKRMVMPYPHIYDHDADDVYKVFKGRGLKVATNLFVRTPSCVNFRGTQYHRHRLPYPRHERMYYSPPVMRLRGLGKSQMSKTTPLMKASNQERYSSAPPPPPPIQTVRTFFPETWIWELLDTGESGSSSLTRPSPHTITTWDAQAFCLSAEGLGMASHTELTVFQPFFLELTLPYSIIRGESFTLKATVFNYLRSCIMMSVEAAPSLDYTLTPLSGQQYTSCLCENERKTLSWTMVPSALGKVNISVSAEAITSDILCDNEVISVPERGRRDVVTKTLLVKAEGTEMTKTHNWLLCPKGAELKEEVELQLPEQVIPGSARASLSVLGDILGRAMQNLEGLLKMPYGCGEQNMALLAPNIYILQYLQNTDQLTPAVREKASNFLSSGYQRQLNYKHIDGAYSTFGSGDGNTWLTAFVVRSLVKAQAFVYIDPEKVLQSRTWLQTQQREDGCFRQSGKLFNNRMKGGVSDEVTLSAYITAAFLEMNVSVSDPVVNMSLSCLRNHSQILENTYTTALMAYVFSLAKDTETRSRLIKKLYSGSKEEGGFVHWPSSEPSSSLSVETSSYVLLSILTQASISAEDLGYASRIVRWLTLQQNPYGGFTSTQDTVVALQALSLYSTLVFDPIGSSVVKVSAPSSSMAFDLNPTNRLLYQERTLQDVSGKYRLEVTGSACASVQISVFYNIPTPTHTNTLKLEVQEQINCEDLRPALRLNLTSLFFGEQSRTNMVILDVKVLSGFTPDQRSLKNLVSDSRVDRVEQKDDHVLIYIRELERAQSVSHELRLEQEMVVHNLKPAVVKIYDYYQPSDQAETEYTSPCAAPKQ